MGGFCDGWANASSILAVAVPGRSPGGGLSGQFQWYFNIGNGKKANTKRLRNNICECHAGTRGESYPSAPDFSAGDATTMCEIRQATLETGKTVFRAMESEVKNRIVSEAPYFLRGIVYGAGADLGQAMNAAEFEFRE